MNPSDTDLPEAADSAAAPAEVEAGADKPKRRRAPRKAPVGSAAAVAAAAAVSDPVAPALHPAGAAAALPPEVEAPATEVDAVPAKVEAVPAEVEAVAAKVDSAPAKVEAAPAKVEAVDTKVEAAPAKVEPVPVGVEVESAPRPEVEAWPASVDAVNASAAAAAAAITAGASAPAAADVAVVGPAAIGPAAEVALAAEAAADPGAQAGAGDDRQAGGRRGRNRRRGRRGGVRDGAAELEGEAAVEPAPGPVAPEVERAPERVAEDVFAQVLAGEFDVEPASEPEPAAGDAPPVASRRVLAADPDAPKLHKVLAQAGVGSRRDLEQMIADQRVTVNGEVAHTGQRIAHGDRIQIDGKPVRFRIAPPPLRVLAYHKPAGEVVSLDDPQQRPTVFRRLPRLQQGKWQSVGRLDINTEGLLLFTTSGELANQLMHPRFGVEREYAVRSLGTLNDEARARLLEGVDVDGQRCGFKSIDDGGGEGVNHWYRCVITEGRNREVRRLFEAVGHAVSRLIRIRYGSVVLPRGLKRGVWVDLDDADLRNLRRLASGPRVERVAEPDAEAAGRRGRSRNVAKRRPDGAERHDRTEPAIVAPRPPREPRPPQLPRAPRPEAGEGGAIPNPLQQTFDKRAIQQERALRREIPEDGPIPNPLQQTYDKRALQRDRAPQREIPEDGPIPNPLQQTYDKRFANGGAGGVAGPKRGRGQAGGQGKRPAGETGRVPDPMQTSIGYIGGDAFLRKGAGRGGPKRGEGGGGTGRGGPRGRGGPGR